MDWAKTTARQDENHLSFGIWYIRDLTVACLWKNATKIFSDVNFKMAAWQPYWIFLFPNSKFSFALNINSKLQWQSTYVYG